MSDVLVRVSGSCGRITLNRPRALNALTLEMVKIMHTALMTWANDLSIQFVLVDGAGERGLCAGGDIRAMYNAVVADRRELATDFFRNEYRLNYFISRYTKPYVVLMDGIVMGGGVGISAHASHRIVTERSELAMPETAIGFVPDVGGHPPSGDRARRTRHLSCANGQSDRSSRRDFLPFGRHRGS